MLKEEEEGGKTPGSLGGFNCVFNVLIRATSSIKHSGFFYCVIDVIASSLFFLLKIALSSLKVLEKCFQLYGRALGSTLNANGTFKTSGNYTENCNC